MLRTIWPLEEAKVVIMARSVSDAFSKVAHWTAQQCGRAPFFIAAALIIVVWVVLGPAFGYSDTWQLIINTGTTIVTFLMVFLIQNTQNRDTTAIQLKLDELIRANQNARNRMVQLEDMTDEELTKLKETFTSLVTPAKEAAGSVRRVQGEMEETGDTRGRTGSELSGSVTTS
jgi:low affinity Fe/Cu permease